MRRTPGDVRSRVRPGCAQLRLHEASFPENRLVRFRGSAGYDLRPGDLQLREVAAGGNGNGKLRRDLLGSGDLQRFAVEADDRVTQNLVAALEAQIFDDGFIRIVHFRDDVND